MVMLVVVREGGVDSVLLMVTGAGSPDKSLCSKALSDPEYLVPRSLYSQYKAIASLDMLAVKGLSCTIVKMLIPPKHRVETDQRQCAQQIDVHRCCWMLLACLSLCPMAAGMVDVDVEHQQTVRQNCERAMSVTCASF